MNRVVITHAGVVCPNGKTFDQFSQSLQQGRSGLARIDYFNPEDFPCQIAGQVPDPDFEGLRQRYPELRRVADNKVMLGVSAFEQILPWVDGEDIDGPLFLGTSLESYQIEKLFCLSPHKFDIDRYVGALAEHPEAPLLKPPLDYLGQFLKARFGLRGAHYLNCSACVASAQAMGHAFHMIRDGRCRRVVVGGFDSMLNPLGMGGFARLGALCTDNSLGTKAIKPFDLRRQGTILGEGSAFLILQERGCAKRNREPILGEVLGYASTCDAYKPSAPEGSGSGIADAMRKALADARVSIDQVDYISAHGTGTRANDRVETMAIKKVFGPRAFHIPVSALKSMIGHLIGASGAVEIVGILAMFRDGFVAPTINLEQPDPDCDLDYVPNKARRQQINIAVKNAMGFGGQNAVLVIGRHV